MHTVLVTKFVPWPPNSGDKRRTLGIARAMQKLGPVTICAFVTDHEDVEGLRAEGFEVRGVPLRRSPLKVVAGLFATGTPSGARFWDAALRDQVTSAGEAGTDVLVVEHVQLRGLAKRLKPAITVIDVHNVESVLADRVAATKTGVARIIYRMEAAALRRVERSSGEADIVAVVSEVDRVALSRVAPQIEAVVIPNAWGAVTPLPPSSDPIVSFMALMSWAPNADAATWFCREVWPLVRERVPAAQLQLVGREPRESVRQLASASIRVSGTVESLDPWYARTAVSIAPLRAGGGSRLKILESLAMGRPVVATAVGAEGLEDLIGRGVVVADTAELLAAEIAGLLQDPALAHRLGAAGAAAVERDHSWEAAVRPLLDRLHPGSGTEAAR